jgi:hypothetical protein
MKTETDPTLAPVGDAFEAAYQLPAGFPEEFRALHAEILTRLRNESRAVPMNTNMLMLIERMTHFYVAMKIREAEADVPFSLKEQKEMLDFWLKMVVEFNKGIAASESKARTTLLVEVQNVLRQSLKRVKDPELRRELASEWNEEFARIDI